MPRAGDGAQHEDTCLEMLSQGFEDFWVEVSSRQLCVGKSDGGVGGSLAGNGDLELF